MSGPAQSPPWAVLENHRYLPMAGNLLVFFLFRGLGCAKV